MLQTGMIGLLLGAAILNFITMSKSQLGDMTGFACGVCSIACLGFAGFLIGGLL